MKKIFLLFVAISFAYLGFSQLTLVKNLGEVADGDVGVVINTNEFFLINTSGNIVIYDDNFNISKTIYINPSVQYNYFLSKNLFTNSGKYEFCVNTPSFNDFYVYDEDGNMIFNFNGYFPSYISGDLLFVNKYVSEYSLDYKVYSLGGWWTKVENDSKNSLSVYPNPASGYVNIRYSVDKKEEVQILDVNGRVVDTVILDPNKEMIKINVSKYNSGVYFYNVNGKSGKFMVR